MASVDTAAAESPSPSCYMRRGRSASTSPANKIVRDLDSALFAIRQQYGGDLPEFFGALQYLRSAIMEVGPESLWEAK